MHHAWNIGAIKVLTPFPHLSSPFLLLLSLLSPHVREESDSWVTEEKLEAHTDWVRDVAWCPSVGLPISRIASCSQVMSVTIGTTYQWVCQWNLS